MTRVEFDRWTEAWFTAFPDSHRWLSALPNPGGTLDAWFTSLKRCEYADVALVTDKIISGELAMIEAYQREQTALHIRAYAGRVADDRAKRQKQVREHEKFTQGRERNRNESGPSMAGMFNAIIKFREEGSARGLEGRELNEYASDKLEHWIAAQSGDMF